MKKSRFMEMKIIYKCPKSAYSRKSDVRWRYKYALKGHPLAMYELAMDYLYWHKLGADGAKAMLWLCKAADAGSVDACYELAEIYKCGFLQLHVLSSCESTEKYLITKNHKLSATYMARAKELERALKFPNGRALYGAGHGWCYFSPSEKIRINVSCAFTGDFPLKIINSLCARFKHDIPVNLFMDSEGRYDLFVESGCQDEALLVQEDLNKISKPQVRKIRCNIYSLAKQIVCDIESDYYGWVTYNYGSNFTKKERLLKRNVERLKGLINYGKS
jgi:hypothetical protein